MPDTPQQRTIFIIQLALIAALTFMIVVVWSTRVRAPSTDHRTDQIAALVQLRCVPLRTVAAEQLFRLGVMAPTISL
jgi:hypothetical protein